MARGKNKALFAVLIDASLPIGDLPTELTGTWQIVDLAHGVPTRTFRVQLPGSDAERHVDFAEVGLTRLRGGLRRAGLDPKFFAWPPAGEQNRRPYPGLAALEAPDAGIFFGREAPLIEARDKLRGLALSAPPRIYVVLGASGAGKSSFLRAGLLPRLAYPQRKGPRPGRSFRFRPFGPSGRRFRRHRPARGFGAGVPRGDACRVALARGRRRRDASPAFPAGRCGGAGGTRPRTAQSTDDRDRGGSG